MFWIKIIAFVYNDSCLRTHLLMSLTLYKNSTFWLCILKCFICNSLCLSVFVSFYTLTVYFDDDTIIAPFWRRSRLINSVQGKMSSINLRLGGIILNSFINNVLETHTTLKRTYVIAFYITFYSLPYSVSRKSVMMCKTNDKVIVMETSSCHNNNYHDMNWFSFTLTSNGPNWLTQNKQVQHFAIKIQ